MKKDEILQSLNEIFAKVLRTNITLEEHFTANDVKNWDSLNHVRLIVEIEKKFKVKFSYMQVEEFKNVGSIVEAIMKNTNS